MPELSIFVSHTREQMPTVRRLTAELTSRGYSIAINRYNVPPGTRIQPALERSMVEAAQCIVCFSAKPGGSVEYAAADLVLANERMLAKPEDASWLIPVILTPCELPAIDFGGALLNELPAIELHADWDGEIEKLVAALPIRNDVTASTSPVSQHSSESARAVMTAEIGTLMTPSVEFTNVEGASGANAESSYTIEKMVVDRSTKFTNVGR
ncbi:MAG: toll/interleukin-1 receptor domain-containing protein [Thermoanaerobaculia bacterium]